MAVQDMHYDFKSKFNKLDSQQNRNLKIPEIDWILNEAEDIYIKTIAFPRHFTHLGFEVNTRSTEDIRPIVLFNIPLPVTSENIVEFPNDFRFFLKGRAEASKGKCKEQTMSFTSIQIDDEADLSLNYSSSFDWRELIGIFQKNGISLLAEDFTVDKFYLSYIQKTPYICFPEGMTGGAYTLPSGTQLNENQSTPLENSEKEIVDIAVMLASGQIQASDYSLKKDKLSVNQFI